jgi:hypothetical protein
MPKQLSFDFKEEQFTGTPFPRFPEDSKANLYTPDQTKSTEANYTANNEVYPTQIIFDNGRVVTLNYEEGHVFLDVSWVSNK